MQENNYNQKYKHYLYKDKPEKNKYIELELCFNPKEIL